MILDRLDNAERYFSLHPGFRPACEFLWRTDFTKLSAGRHEVDGARLYCMLNKGTGRGRDAARLEAHRQYIDIQYTIVGPDEIGWRALATCERVEKPFDAEADFGLFADPPETWITVSAGRFAIFYPEDAHAPLGAPAEREVLKVVMKVAVDWK